MIETTQATVDRLDAEAQKRGSLYATVEEIRDAERKAEKVGPDALKGARDAMEAIAEVFDGESDVTFTGEQVAKAIRHGMELTGLDRL